MAYSDYGGRVYRNGVEINDRCDVEITAEGLNATPGSWPGWAHAISEESLETLGGCYHAALGSGPIFLALYKQSTFCIFRGFERELSIEEIKDAVPDECPAFFGDYEGKPYVDDDKYRTEDQALRITINGTEISLRWTEEDNFYVYARMEEPDGTIWTGWSGYGVGCGLEDGSYGFSSDERDEMLSELFPNSQAA